MPKIPSLLQGRKGLQVEPAIVSFIIGFSLFLGCHYAVGICGYLLVVTFDFLTQNKTPWPRILNRWVDVGYRPGVLLGSFLGVYFGSVIAFRTFKILASTPSKQQRLAAIVAALSMVLFWIWIIATFL